MLNAQKTFLWIEVDWTLNRLVISELKKKKTPETSLLGSKCFLAQGKGVNGVTAQDFCGGGYNSNDSYLYSTPGTCKALCTSLVESSYPFLGDSVIPHIPGEDAESYSETKEIAKGHVEWRWWGPV